VQATADVWDYNILRREQLEEHDMGLVLWEMEVGQLLEWKDIADCSCIYKCCWAQWDTLAVKDGVLKRYGESADGWA
jgi:hypothetical protein